jgi:hypothetical protein
MFFLMLSSQTLLIQLRPLKFRWLESIQVYLILELLFYHR